MLFLDTSALLMYEGFSTESPICFSSYSLRELEDIKFHGKDEKLKAKARSIIRLYIAEPLSFICVNRKEKELEEWRKKFGFLPDNLDSRILLSAYALWREDPTITFLTADALQYSMAHTLGMTATYMENEEKPQEPWKGWRDFYPTEEEMALLYGEPEKNTLGAITNEYCKIWENGELKDILRWSGERYEKLKYKPFKNILGDRIEPRNTEQKIAMDILQNRDTTIKAVYGGFGDGKTFLCFMTALWLLQKGEFEKIVFIRNTYQVKDTIPIAALPGGIYDKFEAFTRQLADHIGEFELEKLIEENRIEVIPLPLLRGRDFKNAILFADEVENCTRQHIQLLIGRIGTGSELWCSGDIKQTDDIKFDRNSGLLAMLNKLKGYPRFSAVKLIKSERSETAAMADILD